MYPHGKNGHELIAHLVEEIHRRPEITVFTTAEVVSKSGSLGNYQAGIQVQGDTPVTIQVRVGAIIVATGFDTYMPEVGEFGYGIEGVVTLPEFRQLIDESPGQLVHQGKPVRSIAYIY